MYGSCSKVCFIFSGRTDVPADKQTLQQEGKYCPVHDILLGKFSKALFSFCSKNNPFVITAGIHRMLVSIANREDPDQTASSEFSRGILIFSN